MYMYTVVCDIVLTRLNTLNLCVCDKCDCLLVAILCIYQV